MVKAMQVREVIETLGLKLMTHEVPVDVDVIGGYASDLLSNVMGQAAPGMIWVTTFSRIRQRQILDDGSFRLLALTFG